MFEKINQRLRDFISTRTGFVVAIVALALTVALALDRWLLRESNKETKNV